MTFKLEIIEQHAIEIILNTLDSLKNKNLTNNETTDFIPISIIEKIVYTLVCYTKINENTMEMICSDLNAFLSTNILIPPESKEISKLLDSFKILNEQPQDPSRASWIINVLKESIYSKKLLNNTNYMQQIIDQTLIEIDKVMIQLNKQKNILYRCSNRRFKKENYQNVIQQYHILNNRLDILNEELLNETILLIPKINNLHNIYQQITEQHNSVEIIANLNLYNKNILNVYNNNIIKQNYSIKEIKCYIEEQQMQMMHLYYELPKYNFNPHYYTLAKKSLMFFNEYYNQCKIVFDIDELNIELHTIQEILLQHNYKCLSQDDYEKKTNNFEVLSLKIKNLNSTIYNIMSKKIKELKQNYQTISNIYKIRAPQYVLLTQEQEHFVNLFFQYNTEITKFSKKVATIDFNYQSQEVINIIKEHNNILPLMYSVIKDHATNKLFVILPSKKSTIILRNAIEKSLTGLIGKGTYGKVKLVQSLTDYSIIVVKIQLGKIKNIIKNEEINNEENIQKMLNQFVFSCQIHKDKLTKYYIFSKYISGEKVFDYFNKNPNLTIEEFMQIILKIFHKMDYLHNTMNIIHADLSFSNMLYDPTTKLLEIIDFGFSGIADEYGMINFPEIISNKKSYIAKECYLLRKATFTSDIHSVGWWIKFYVNNNKFHNIPQTPCLFKFKFTKFLDKMLKENYNSRPKITDCITEFESLLNDCTESKPKFNYF